MQTAKGFQFYFILLAYTGEREILRQNLILKFGSLISAQTENIICFELYFVEVLFASRGGSKSTVEPTKWGHTTIKKILTTQEYCGVVINFKSYSKSYKMKRRIENPEENWAIFLNVHEPIIDRPTWEKVQALKAGTRRKRPHRYPKSPRLFWLSEMPGYARSGSWTGCWPGGGELDMLVERLYEDNGSGKIDDTRFSKISKRYEQEQGENTGRTAQGPAPRTKKAGR